MAPGHAAGAERGAGAGCWSRATCSRGCAAGRGMPLLGYCPKAARQGQMAAAGEAIWSRRPEGRAAPIPACGQYSWRPGRRRRRRPSQPRGAASLPAGGRAAGLGRLGAVLVPVGRGPAPRAGGGVAAGECVKFTPGSSSTPGAEAPSLECLLSRLRGAPAAASVRRWPL